MDVSLTNNNYEMEFNIKTDIFGKTTKIYYLGSNGDSIKDLVRLAGLFSDSNTIQKEVLEKRALFLNKLREFKVSFAYLTLLKWVYGLEEKTAPVYDKIMEKYPFLKILSFEDITDIITKDEKLKYSYENCFVIAKPWILEENCLGCGDALFICNQNDKELQITINKEDKFLSPSEKILIGDLKNKEIIVNGGETYLKYLPSKS